MTELPVLVEQSVWPEFRAAIEAFTGEWIAPSGRLYRLRLAEDLRVTLELGDLGSPPSGEDIDRDLFALAGMIFDEVGGEWSADALRQVSSLWGWEPG